MRFAALAITGVMILTTEKLDVVVVLVEVEIEIAAALRAFQQARDLYFLHSVHVWVGEQKEESAEIDSRDWLPWDNLSQGTGI